MPRSRIATSSSASYTLFALREWSPQLIALLVLLVIVFMTGGTSRYDTPQLLLLRPVSVLMFGFALITMTKEHWVRYRPIFLIFGAATLLTAIHLVPLPPGLWQALPGRQVIVEIDVLAGMTDQWRPLTMFPEGTWNALYALVVPFAALLLASQLSEQDNIRLLVLVIALCLLSGLIGVVQAAGSDLRFYRVSHETPGLFANRNHQAAMLAALFPMLGALAQCSPSFSKEPRIVKWIAGAGLLALLPLIVVTGSRMGLVVGAMAFICLFLLYFEQNQRARKRRFGGAIKIAASVLAALAMIFSTMFVARDEAISRMDGVQEELRWSLWQSILEFLPEYLPWGSGIGSYVPIYQIHERPDLLMPTYSNQAHNDWLDIPLTSGIPGVILALVAVAMFAFAAKIALKARGIGGHLRRAGLVVILVLAFASLSDYPLRTPILSALFAIAAVWAWSPINHSSHKERIARHG